MTKTRREKNYTDRKEKNELTLTTKQINQQVNQEEIQSVQKQRIQEIRLGNSQPNQKASHK